MERSVKLSYGTFYEQLHDEGRRGLLATKAIKARAMAIEASKKDGFYTRFIILTDLGDTSDMDLMPRIDKEDVSLELLVPFKVPRIPVKEFTDEERVADITDFLARGFPSPLTVLHMLTADPGLLQCKMMPFLMDVVADQDNIEKNEVMKFSADACKTMTKGLKDSLTEWDVAENVGQIWDNWKATIRDWIVGNLDKLGMPPISHKGNPMLRAMRVEMPSSLRKIGSAMYIADVPLVRDWPLEAGEPPHLQLDVPLLEKVSDLEGTVQTALDRESALKKGDNNPHMFKMVIHRDNTDTTMNMELSAISNLTVHENDHSMWAKFSRWLLKFSGQVIEHQVSDMFPILKAVSDRAKLLNVLQECSPDFFPFSAEYDVNSGKWSDGIPPGKSDSQLDMPSIEHKALGAPDVIPADYAPVPSLVPSLVGDAPDRDLVEAFWQEYLLLDADQRACILGMESLPFGLQAIFGVPGAGKTRLLLLVVAMCCSAKILLSDAQALVSSERYESRSSQTGHGGHDSVADTPGTPAQDQSASAFAKAAEEMIWPRAFVSATTNSQVDDICSKLQELVERLNLPIRVVRLNAIQREMRNVINKGCEQKDIVYDDNSDYHLQVLSEIELSKICNTFDEDRIARRKLKGGVLSVSELAYFMVMHDTSHELVEPIRHLMQARADDPRFFQCMSSLFRQLWQNLIEHIISNASIVVGTPVIAKKLANFARGRSIFKPQIVWSDEAGRATEAAGLAAMTFFRDSLVRLLSGDPNQCEKVGFSREGIRHDKDSDRYFVNPFVNQYMTSIIKRMQEGGAPISHLRISHRMRGGLEVFPSRQFYRNRMTTSHTDHDEEVPRFRSFLQMYCAETTASSLLINITKGVEEKVLTSYNNLANANFGIRLVIEHFQHQLCGKNPTQTSSGKRASILIIAPYEGQRELYKGLLSKLSPSEYVPELVKVQTIATSQGMEADTVIFDTVRTSNLGFLNQHANANVALTRARYCLIVLGSHKCWKGPRATVFENLRKNLDQRGAVRFFKSDDVALDCNRCHGMHTSKTCKARLTCPNCPEDSNDHHVRNCRGKNVQKMEADLPAGHELPEIVREAPEKRSRNDRKKAHKGQRSAA